MELGERLGSVDPQLMQQLVKTKKLFETHSEHNYQVISFMASYGNPENIWTAIINTITFQGSMSGRQDMRGDGGEVGGGADSQRSLLRPQGSLQRAWQHRRSLAQVSCKSNQIYLESEPLFQ